MVDGEGCERLWSYLRRFSRITKETTPSHRTDILADALLYYGRLSSDRFGRFLNDCLFIIFTPRTSTPSTI